MERDQVKDIFEIVKNNALFAKIGIDDFDKMLTCMEMRRIGFKKGQEILLAGNPVQAVGVVLRGSVQIIHEDMEGRIHIITELPASELFGETFACAGIDHSPVTVMAVDDCEILFLNYRKIITTCSSACTFHTHLIENMLALLAQKNLFLNRKIEILSKRSTRERLMLFFETRCGASRKFTIPYNREELAALLCVERSSMSGELSRMQADGLIRFHKNEFELL